MSWYKNLGESLAEGLAGGVNNFIQADNAFSQQRQQQANVEADRAFRQQQADEQARQYDENAAFQRQQDATRNDQWQQSFGVTKAQEGRAATEWTQQQAIKPFSSLIEDIDGQITELTKVMSDGGQPLHVRTNAKLGLASLKTVRMKATQQRTAAWQGKFGDPSAAAQAYDDLAGELVGLTGRDYLRGEQVFGPATPPPTQTVQAPGAPDATLSFSDTPPVPAPRPDSAGTLPGDPTVLESLARTQPGAVGQYTDEQLAATYGRNPDVLSYVTEVRDNARLTAVTVRERDEAEIYKTQADGILAAAKNGKLNPAQSEALQYLQGYQLKLSSATSQTTPEEDALAAQAYSILTSQQVYTLDSAAAIFDKNTDGTYKNPERIAMLLRNPDEAARYAAVLPGFQESLAAAGPAIQTYVNRAQDAADLSAYNLTPEQLADPSKNPEALRPLLNDLNAFIEKYNALPDDAARQQFVVSQPVLSRLSSRYATLNGVIRKVDAQEQRQADDAARAADKALDDRRAAFMGSIGLDGAFTPDAMNAAAKMLSSNAALRAQAAQYGITPATLGGAVDYLKRNPTVDARDRVNLLPTVTQSLAVLYPDDRALAKALTEDRAAVAKGKPGNGLAALFDTYGGILGGPGALIGAVSTARTTWANKLSKEQADAELTRAQTTLTRMNVALRPQEVNNQTTTAVAAATNAATGQGRLALDTEDVRTDNARQAQEQQFNQQLDVRKQAASEARDALASTRFSWQQKQDLIGNTIRQSQLAISTYNALNKGGTAGSDPTLKKLDGDLSAVETQLGNTSKRLAVLEKKGTRGPLGFSLRTLTPAEQAEYQRLTGTVTTLNSRYNNLVAKRLNYTPPAGGQATGSPVTLSVGPNGAVTLGQVTVPRPATTVPAGKPIPTTGLPAGPAAPAPKGGPVLVTPPLKVDSAVPTPGLPRGMSKAQDTTIRKQLITLRTNEQGLATYLRGLSKQFVGPGKPFASDAALLAYTKGVLNLR